MDDDTNAVNQYICLYGGRELGVPSPVGVSFMARVMNLSEESLRWRGSSNFRRS